MGLALLPWLLGGCDLFVAPPIGPAEQMLYTPLARQQVQTIERWWPLLVEPAPMAGPAYGTPPFALPASYASGLTESPLDYPGFPTQPEQAFCENSLCTIRWRGLSQGDPYALTVSIDTEQGILSATSWITTQTWGTWVAAYGPRMRLRKVHLEDLRFSPLSRWQIDCNPDGEACSLAVSFRGGVLGGGLETSPGRWAYELQPREWSEGFPWAGIPTLVRHDPAPGVDVLRVFYANGLEFERRLDRVQGSWLRSGPPADVLETGHAVQDSWQISARFGRSQVLFERDTEWQGIPAPGGTARVHERRTDSRARRSEVEAEFRYEGALILGTWRVGNWVGRSQIRRTPPGWRVEGFLESDGGELLSYDGIRYDVGFWTGSFAGWRPRDQNRPYEEGDFQMLPDGSLQASFLLLQLDGSYAEVESASPPEGISPLEFDR